MTEARLEQARRVLEKFRDRKILVVGDVMLDRFVWGDVNRISPEAPVPVVRVREETVRLGGAANVAANLSSLGAVASVGAVIGNDEAGREIGSELQSMGITPVFHEDPGRATTVKTRVLARSQQVVRVDRETDRLLGGACLRELTTRLMDSMTDAEGLVISDYEKGVVCPDLLKPVLEEAAGRGIPVVVDPKLVHFEAYQPITVLTPNQAEAARATAMRITDGADCLEAAGRIMARLDTRAVLVTRGDRGMLLCVRGREPVRIPAMAREVYDVTGAGDTVVAVMTLALAAGAELQDAAVLANAAGAVVVGKVGTATVTTAELLDYLGRFTGPLDL